MAMCQVCGATFEARRSTAKYCSKRCKSRAERMRAGYPAERAASVMPRFGVGIDDATEIITRASERAEDASRLACRLPEPYSGRLDALARAIAAAIGDGLR